MTERLPYPDERSMSAETRRQLDARPPRNVFRMLANAPALLPGLMELTGAILYRARLAPALRELIILRVGALCGSEYEVHQHRKIAAAIGLDTARIDAAVATDAAPAGVFDATEACVLALTDQVVRQVRADDAVFAAVVAALGAELAMEILIVIGTYVLLAQVLRNTDVAIEPDGGPAPSDVRRLFAAQAARSAPNDPTMPGAPGGPAS